MKQFVFSLGLIALLVACVPAKKYNDLVAREKSASEELSKYKAMANDFEGKSKDLTVAKDRLNGEVKQLKTDTTRLGNDLRVLAAQYDYMVAQNEAYENKLDQMRMSGARETANYQADIEAKNLELQRKAESLNNLEKELITKQNLLSEREERVVELEEMIKRQEEAMTTLKTKVASALKSFENKGLTVEQRNGKIYVSMEAKLLFPSGSTAINDEGKKVLIEVAKVLENEKDLEIVVEGHTDTDKLSSPNHPKNNWELSVLRSTAVVEILLANSKMKPSILSASGRGEFQPIDPKDKAKNRRIEIIISPDLKSLFQLIEN